MWVLGICISVLGMARETECGCLALEQRITCPRMTTMTGQTVTFSGRLMCTLNALFLLPLVMTIQADLGRFLSQHTSILTGMYGVARLAVALFDRFVLCCARDTFMTGQAEPISKRLQLDSGAFKLVTVIAVTAADRRVDHLPEQTWICRTVLGMTADAPGCDGIVLMCRNETDVANVVAGHTQFKA
jgi:hypothetical protein